MIRRRACGLRDPVRGLRGNADLPARSARSRQPEERPATARLAAENPSACSAGGGARSPDRRVLEAPHRPADRSVEILRLSAYQLLALTRVPASAVVDERESGRGAGKGARADSSTPCWDDLAPGAPLFRSRSGRGSVDRRRRSSISASRSPSALGSRAAGTTGSDSTPPTRVTVQQHGRTASRANRLRLTPEQLTNGS